MEKVGLYIELEEHICMYNIVAEGYEYMKILTYPGGSSPPASSSST
jgi:hypothetical protein